MKILGNCAARPRRWQPHQHCRHRQPRRCRPRARRPAHSRMACTIHILIHLRVMQRVSPFVPFGDGQRQVRVKNGGQRVHERHIRLNTGVAFGRHIGNRAHQQTASGSAVGHGAPSISQMRLLQRACGVHEVLKGMLLVQSAPLLIPGASHFAAATNMRHGVQHTAIQHAQTRDREPRIGGNLVCTYPVMNIGESCAGQSRCQTRETGMRSPSRAVIHTRRSM